MSGRTDIDEINHFAFEQLGPAAVELQICARADLPVARRDGRAAKVDVNQLVPGDVIELTLGELVPADVRLLSVNALECNESILTGESQPTEKSTDPAPPGTVPADAADLAFVGTVVSAGSATAVVYATGLRAQFGQIAAGLGERQPETDFPVGLRRFSYLLLWVALTLTVLILVANLLLRRPLIDAVLFSPAIAVGITPQLLPAVVSTSLSTGSRRLAALKALVKRLVCIEDLGDIDVLITDKTGMLTTDVDPALGGTSANPLDAALWDAALWDSALWDSALWDSALWDSVAGQQISIADVHRITELPFDHDRRAASTLVEDSGTRTLIHKGAPEPSPRCRSSRSASR